MKTVFDHIEHVRAQPHHIRKQVAFASAAIGAGIIAVVWFTASISTGAFAIRESSFAGVTEPQNAATTRSDSDGRGVAGVAAALPQSANDTVPAHIEIVDTSPAPTPRQKQAEQTTIPF